MAKKINGTCHSLKNRRVLKIHTISTLNISDIFSDVSQHGTHDPQSVFGHHIPHTSLAKESGLHNEDNRLR